MNSAESQHFFYSKFHPNNLDLIDEQWELVQPLLLGNGRLDGRGRPPVPLRNVLDGVLWKLRSDAAWDELPGNYPSHQTCYRYYRRWLRYGILDEVIRLLTRHLDLNSIALLTGNPDRDFDILDSPLGSILQFSPHLRGTWQASTAQLILQFFFTKARKLGRLKGRLIPASQ